MEKNVNFRLWFKGRTPTVLARTIVSFLCAALIVGFPIVPALAAPGKTTATRGKASASRIKKVAKQKTRLAAALKASAPVEKAPGGILVTPRVAPAFLFEPEFPPASLKSVPIWNELDQMLDNPYAVAPDPATPVNAQGFPSYRTTIKRRPSFLPQPLPQFLVHPLNYNPNTGEEMRLLNPAFPTVNVEPGEPALDNNSPFFNDGGDPGEPNYGGFGVLVPNGYSLPAVPNVASPTTTITGIGTTHRLFDPERGFINPRDPVTGVGGLRKPSISIPPYGTPLHPGYTVNTDPANIAPSNENDYYRKTSAGLPPALQPGTRPGAGTALPIGRDAAIVLGKAFFWDMQVGSDCVQSCGSCHFKALVDDRTKNQLNPNTLGGDTTSISVAGSPPITGANQEVNASHFPLTKLANLDLPGGADVPGNVTSTTNDVMSSMGVVFSPFTDIPTPGPAAFGAPVNGVRSLLPDIRTPGAIDPVPVFQGLRRVEPRNTPSLFSAVMNFDNFWDGRARHDFNGGSVFGASDPQNHVFANNGTPTGGLTATRQIIRFSSLASLATGPGLSNFEMSFDGRNWAKIAKKLLQTGVTPLANQLVSPTDSVLGPFSGQRSQVGGPVDRPGRPGLNISYPDLIRLSFNNELWANVSQHLDGHNVGLAQPPAGDPFDGFNLTIGAGPATAANTLQFTQMEGNFSLFWGLAIQAWGQILIPDDTMFDRFCDANPEAFRSVGEPGEPNLIPPDQIPPVTPVGFYTRTPAPGAPDPLLGFDLFFGSNLSLKNPNFLTAKCGACHLGPNLTDHNVVFSHAGLALDFIAEFVVPGVEIAVEPLLRPRLISGFLLEQEFNENAQDAVERFIANQSVFTNPVTGLADPDGSSFIDNGVYNIGVTPIDNDISRGGDDPFGWPLSLCALMLKNLGGPAQEPGTPLPTFDPALGVGGGLFGPTAQDQSINPGLEADPLNPLLPPHLAPWASNVNVGNAHPEMDEVFGGLNALTEDPIIEGYVDILGPFNPQAVLNEALTSAEQPLMGTWPVVNRVLRNGSFKAPQLRNVELTGPYFHNGGKLTLRQVVDFYLRGGDHPFVNGPHRDFNIVDLRTEIQSAITEEQAVSLVDFLLTLTDERVRFERAPFDHPEVFVPLDGTAPDNGALAGGVASGRQGFLNNTGNGLFQQVPAVGAAGRATPLQPFLNLTTQRLVGPAALSTQGSLYSR